MHLRILLCHLPPLSTTPDHEGVHGPLDVVVGDETPWATRSVSQEAGLKVVGVGVIPLHPLEVEVLDEKRSFGEGIQGWACCVHLFT